jgi:tetratricopeptide (TPR) repeat protein
LLAAVLTAALAPRAVLAAESRRLRKGRIYYKSGKYQEAVTEFRAAVEEDSRDAAAHLWLGKSYMKIAEPEKAVENLGEANRLDPENEESYRELGSAHLQLAGRYRAKGETKLADRHVQEARDVGQALLQRDPQDKESYEFLVRLAQQQDDLDQAIRYCEKVLEIDPNDVSTHLQRIDILLKQDRVDEAERRCNEVLQINPKLHAPKLTLSRIYQRRGDHEGAIKILTQIIDERKSHLEARLRRAEIYLARQNYEKALEDADAVARYHENHPYAHFIRGAVFMQLKKLDDAIEEFRRAAAHPVMQKHFACHFWLARCLLVKEQLRDAVDELNTAIAINPDFIPARLILASTQLQQGYPDGAVDVLLDAHAAAPDNTEVLRLLGVSYLHMGEHNKAHTYFQRILEIDPESARAHQILAGLALAKKNVGEAIQHCLKALEAEPQNVDIHFLLGLAYLQRGRLEGAEGQFRRVLDLRTRHPGARMNLARVYIRRRQFTLAEEQLLRCLQEDPALTEPRYRLAALYIKEEKWQEAKEQLDKILELDTDNRAKALTALAEFHRRRGDKDEALSAARRALTADPNFLTAHLFIASLHRADQNWGTALAELEAALKKNRAFAPGYEAAVIHMHLGQYREALRVFDRALRNDVARRHTLIGSAAANQFLGDYQAARANISLAEKAGRPSAITVLINANIYLASGDAISARSIIKRASEKVLPDSIRASYLALVDRFANDRDRARQIADALTSTIFFASRGWHEEAERSARPLFTHAPDNTFVHNVLANVYLVTGEHEKYEETIEKLIELAPKEPSYRIRLGSLYLARGHFKDARDQLEKAVEANPESAKPHVALAAYFRQTAQYEKAIEEAEKARELEDDNTQALQILARCYRATGDLEKAKEALSQLVELTGTAAEDAKEAAVVRSQLARLNLLEGKTDEAIKIYEELLKSKRDLPNRAAIYLGLAYAFEQKGQFTDAITNLKNALNVDATNAAALLRMAHIYRRTGRPHLALETAERAATINPSAPAIRRELAAIHLAMDHYELAIEQYQELVKDNPEDLNARLSIAEIHFRSGDHATAIKQLTNLVENNPQVLPARGALVGFYKRLGQTDKALPHLEALVQATPRLLGAPDLVVAYIHQGRLDDAAAIARKAIQGSPAPAMRLAEAVLQQLDGRYDEAATTLADLHADSPKNAHLASLAANGYLAAGQPEKAREAIEEAEFHEQQIESKTAYLELIDQFNPNTDAARTVANTLNLAGFYADTGWHRLAQEKYDSLPDTVRNNLAILHMVAHVNEQMGDTAGAIAAYEQMLKVQPSYPHALNRLVRHYAQAEDYGKAEGIVRELLKTDPRNTQLQIQLATLLQQQEKADEAIERYRHVIRVAPNEPIAYNNLAWIYAETGNLVEAEALAKRALKLTSPDSGAGAAVRDTLGWIYYRTQRYDEAMKLLQEAVTSMPGSAEVRYHLGMTLFERDLRASAARQLVLALKLEPDFPHKGRVEDVLDRIRRGLP